MSSPHTHPTVDQLPRMDIELHVQAARSRRLVAVIEYQTGENLKLERQANTTAIRLQKEYAMLHKEIGKLDAATDRVDARLVRIDNLKNQLGLVEDLLTLNKDG
jgi:uncharacterized membrane protein YccC